MTSKKFGRYEIETKIAEGAMGAIYRAWDPVAQRRVAVKTVKDEVLAQDATGDYLRRFQREARATGGLSHPNIITIYDVGEKYFVMELLEGTSLLDHLDQKGPLPLSAVTPIISPIADALRYAHTKGIFHRDIKPANIMILPDGTPKLMDFGLAHLESTLLTASGQFLGSPSYMSPEQIKGEPMSPTADHYALAVVTYEMLTGHKPFPGKNITTVIHRVIHEDPVPPGDWNKGLPPQYNDIFRRALAKEPHKRFAHFSELLTALHLKELDSIQLPAPDVSRPVATVSDEMWGTAETIDYHPFPAVMPKPVQESRSSTTERKPRRRRRWFARRTAIAGTLAGVLAAISWLIASLTATPPVPQGFRVDTDPPGAEIWLDGEKRGLSPFELTALSTGEHTLRLTREFYNPVEETFVVDEGKRLQDLFVRLSPRKASLFLETNPAAATVLIDGEKVGISPLESFYIEPGLHEIRVEKAGFRAWSQTVEARTGESLNLVARLARRDR